MFDRIRYAPRGPRCYAVIFNGGEIGEVEEIDPSRWQWRAESERGVEMSRHIATIGLLDFLWWRIGAEAPPTAPTTPIAETP